MRNWFKTLLLKGSQIQCSCRNEKASLKNQLNQNKETFKMKIRMNSPRLLMASIGFIDCILDIQRRCIPLVQIIQATQLS